MDRGVTVLSTLEQQREQYTDSNFVSILSKQTGVASTSLSKNETESHETVIMKILQNANNLMNSLDIDRILKSENRFYPTTTASVLSRLYSIGKVDRIKLMRHKRCFYYALPDKFKKLSVSEEVPEKVKASSNPIFENATTAVVTNLEDLENQVVSAPKKSFWARLLGIL